MSPYKPIRLKPLVVCLTALLGLHCAAATAATWTVTTCDDSYTGSTMGHTGSLRFVAANALDPDNTIDLTHLTCSAITLRNGAITLSQPGDITINGPTGATPFIITGRYSSTEIEQDRIINHTGTGHLTLSNLTVKYGNLTGTTVSGGCIYSNGPLTLDHVNVLDCKAYGSVGYVLGGGVYAKNDTWIFSSNVSNNTASGLAFGGGLFIDGSSLVISNSTISNNSAVGGYDGGLVARRASIWSTTISGNTATTEVGGARLFGYSVISNSTISGNTALAGPVGGLLVGALGYSQNTIDVYNSTIAFNTAGNGGTGLERSPPAAGIALLYGPIAALVHNSLITNNMAGGAEYDLGSVNLSSPSFTGEGNLVGVAAVTGIPIGFTISGACPLLGPLRSNGGPTQTHALLSHSPGIDQGDQSIMLPQFDQRGQPFVRVSGSAPDIGAYEVDQNDTVFNAGFDGCSL